MKHKIHRLAMVVFLVLFGCRQSKMPSAGPVEGVWRVAEVKTLWQGGDALNPKPQPGLFIFTKKHYGIVWIPGDGQRKSSNQAWFPTDAEKIYDFNTVIVNSGTYALKDSMLTTNPVVAKTPEFMGGWARFVFRVSDDSLWLTGTDIYSRDCIRDPGVDLFRTTVKLIRAE